MVHFEHWRHTVQNKSSAWVQRDGGWVGGWAEQPGSACTREELMLGVGYTTETSFTLNDVVICKDTHRAVVLSYYALSSPDSLSQSLSLPIQSRHLYLHSQCEQHWRAHSHMKAWSDGQWERHGFCMSLLSSGSKSVS